MKHFAANVITAAQSVQSRFRNTVAGLLEGNAAPQGICYTMSPAFVRSFATSGLPFLTYYEFNDLTGWYRDMHFAPDNVPGYSEEVGKIYTVWTHRSVSEYHRHIILDELKRDIQICFEIPSLEAAAYIPLRIRLFDAGGTYFVNDQKLVFDRLSADGPRLTSWKKIPALKDSLPRLHLLTSPDQRA